MTKIIKLFTENYVVVLTAGVGFDCCSIGQALDGLLNALLLGFLTPDD